MSLLLQLLSEQEHSLLLSELDIKSPGRSIADISMRPLELSLLRLEMPESSLNLKMCLLFGNEKLKSLLLPREMRFSLLEGDLS